MVIAGTLSGLNQTDNSANAGDSAVPTFKTGDLVTYVRSFNSARVNTGSTISNASTSTISVNYNTSVPMVLFDAQTLTPNSGTTSQVDTSSVLFECIGMLSGRIGTNDIGGGFNNEQVCYLLVAHP